MRKIANIIFLVLLSSGLAIANADLQTADSCYAARAENAKGDKADPENARLMIEATKKQWQILPSQKKPLQGI